MSKMKRDPKSVNIANQIIEEYQPQSVEEMLQLKPPPLTVNR